MPGFTTRSLVSAPPERVFGFILDLRRWTLFRGFGPVPGIAEATLPAGGPLGAGSRVRVRNTDGTVHHEVVTEFVPARRYAARMEVAPPASRLLEAIEEEVDLLPAAGGTEIVRRLEMRPRSRLLWPLVWLVCHAFLKRGVIRHNEAVRTALARET